tara:strand:- start:288 stop:1055 length:768 start_codon:yes stop_codon:yes gene_type:complete
MASSSMAKQLSTEINSAKKQLDIAMNQYNSVSSNDKSSNAVTVAKIAELANAKIILMETLLALYLQAQNNAANTRVNVANQITLADVASVNNKNATKTLAKLKTEKVAHQRQAEINTYYAKEYQARSGIMKILVLTCIPLLILLILKRFGILPDYVVNILSFTVFLIGLILFMWKAYDLSRRSNMNYDEYRFEIMPDASSASNTETVYEYDKQQWDNRPTAYEILQDVHSELDTGSSDIKKAAYSTFDNWTVGNN